MMTGDHQPQGSFSVLYMQVLTLMQVIVMNVTMIAPFSVTCLQIPLASLANWLARVL